MKRLIMLAALTLAVACTAVPASADVIKGRLGVTGRLGFTIPTDGIFVNPSTSALDDYKADADFIGGGGFIYGIDRNFAAEIDVTRTSFDAHIPGGKQEAEIINVSLGGQYRFIPQERLVPYVGAGLDILLNDLAGGYDVDPTVGIHGAVGVDYFILKPLALTAEAKIIAGPETDINDHATGRRVGRFSTTNFAGTFGVRFFFN